MATLAAGVSGEGLRRDGRVEDGCAIHLQHRILRDLSVQAGVADGFCANADDAQFGLHRPFWRRLRSGIYRIEIDVHSTQGHLDGPAIYPAIRGVFSEATRIDLPPPDASGRISATLRLDQSVRQLRFDPTRSPCTFAFAGAKLWRLADAPATGWRLALNQLRVHARERGWRDALAHACNVLRQEGARRLVGDGGAPASDPVAAAAAAYGAWVERFDRLDAVERAAIVARIPGLAHRPLISVLLPVFDPPLPLLRRCIDSVMAQIYPHWELCIADDASSDPAVPALLAEYAAADARVRVVRRSENGHIARASNTALDLARGEFIALLDHDDELAEQALFRVAERIAGQEDVALLYSDEDKLDAQGQRFEPYFKPDWNPQLLLAQNYVNHLVTLRTALVREVGGFRVGFEGAQDYDLVLRCTERLQPRLIAHLPRVLYHWRAMPGSTALAGDEKGYAAAAGLRALADHLQRMQIDATAEMASAGHYRVRHRLPQRAPRVCLVIPTRDRVDLLSRCVDSLLAKTSYPDYEVLVVDNGSRERATMQYFERIARDRRVRVLRHDIPFNYSALNNFGVEHSDAPLVGLLNNDLEAFQDDWLEEMASQALQPGVGAVGAMLYYPGDRIQHAGVVVGLGGVAGHAYKGCARNYPGQMNRARLSQSLSAVTAACLLVRRQAYAEVGGLDPLLPVAFNDVDFCLRLCRAGYRNVWTPYAALYHWESASRGYEDSPEKQARFAAEVEFMRQRWGACLQHDPAYNPNLSLSGDAYTLAWPPRPSAPEEGSEP